jgi:hypothetical protein
LKDEGESWSKRRKDAFQLEQQLFKKLVQERKTKHP